VATHPVIWTTIAALAWTPAMAQLTPCPTVSNGVSILSVNVVGAPAPVGFSGYDIETGYLTVSYTNSQSQMFVGVPKSFAQSGKVQYANLHQFHQAIMQERSTCPILYQGPLAPMLAQP
jgi:hypothetical protein